MATEKRLIDANGAILELFAIRCRESGIPAVLADWLAGAVANAPTVDAVEVVRCKDCLYWEEYDGEMFCLCNANLMTDTAPDDFCSYGERKDND